MSAELKLDDGSKELTLVDVPIVSYILTPGSSLHPTFLLIVDGVFVFLLLVLILLLFVTGGNLHFIFLICISLALWASVKWFVNELRHASSQTASSRVEGHDSDDSTEESKKER